MRAIHLVALFAAAACSDAGDDSASPASQTVTTDGGHFTLTLTAEPDPPVAGDAMLHMDISMGDTVAAGGTVAVTPWMTAMDHGVADAPAVTEPSDGQYVATWVYSMSGTWDVTIDVDAMDTVDTVTVTYEVQ